MAGAGTARASTLPAPAVPQPPPSTSVFFAFDDSTIGSEYLVAIERMGRHLAASPQATLRIEGHADERGSREYNLALGQKRAQAVVQALRILGVRDRQLDAVSFGEERPLATGRDETSWARNRRADLLHGKQP
jgi:peptidoglycan-associated lipoprotein